MKKWIKKLKNRKGFTLIEMLIVLVIVGLLMAIIIPNVSGQKDRIEERAKQNITEIVVTQLDTASMVSPDATITLEYLGDNGYLTQKQVDEAVRLLEISESQTLSKEQLLSGS